LPFEFELQVILLKQGMTIICHLLLVIVTETSTPSLPGKSYQAAVLYSRMSWLTSRKPLAALHHAPAPAFPFLYVCAK
jgi:hypothetical protein